MKNYSCNPVDNRSVGIVDWAASGSVLAPNRPPGEHSFPAVTWVHLGDDIALDMHDEIT